MINGMIAWFARNSVAANLLMVFIILMITAALITPGGDPVSLSLLTLPMYFLYEMSIIFSRRIEKKREKRELAEQ